MVSTSRRVWISGSTPSWSASSLSEFSEPPRSVPFPARLMLGSGLLLTVVFASSRPLEEDKGISKLVLFKLPEGVTFQVPVLSVGLAVAFVVVVVVLGVAVVVADAVLMINVGVEIEISGMRLEVVSAWVAMSLVLGVCMLDVVVVCSAAVDEGGAVDDGGSEDEGSAVDNGDPVDEGGAVDEGSAADEGGAVDDGGSDDDGSAVVIGARGASVLS